MPRITPDLSIRTFKRFDGSVWRQYETEGYRILLSGAGRHLFSHRRMHRLLGPYIEDYVQHNEGVGGSRVYLAEGGNAKLFSLGDDLAVKESRPNSSSSLFASMDRTDRLKDVVERRCPRWIDIPKNYGALISKKTFINNSCLSKK